MLPRSAFSCLVLGLLSSLAPNHSHAVLTWSGPSSPCGSTLQGCINGAPPGEVIEVATNGPVNEDLTVSKSLTVRAAAGFNPVLGGVRNVFLSNPDPLANTIVFEDLTLPRGRVRATQQSSGAFHVTVRDVTIQNTFNRGPEVWVRGGSPGPFGPVVLELSGNRLTVPAASQSFSTHAISVEAEGAASMTGAVRGNRIDHLDGDTGAAIGLSNNAAELNVDVIANEIRGANYNNGVLLFQFGAGTSDVRFLDNLVEGQTNAAGGPGSYVIEVSQGSATFEIINNTAADGDIGIRVAGRDDLGASWSGMVANNIVSVMSGFGVILGQPTLTSGTVQNEHNLVFNVGSNSFVPGPGTVFADPLFVGGGNYRLTDPSPARNAGNSARVPADLTADLDGNPRMVGRVDMGAYESTSPLASMPGFPDRHLLLSNVPNPFRSSTAIRYELSRPEKVRLAVFDLQGRLVRWLVPDALQDATRHASAWDGRDAGGLAMPSGVYLCRLEAGQFLATRRMLLMR